jgi:phage terminase large subunit
MAIVLRPYQQQMVDYLDAGGLRAVCCNHRRSGKDVQALSAMYRQACQRVGLYLYFLPVISQAKRVIWHAKFQGQRLLDAVIPPDAVESKNENDLRLHLRNGSIIWFLGSDNYDRIVGSTAVGLVFSEFALAKPQGWDLLRPILKESKGWACFISTPRGRNAFHALYEVARSDPTWFCSQLSIHDTGALPASILEEERRSGMSPGLINSEYLVSWDAAQVGSVYGDLLEELANRQAITPFELDAGADVYTTWDLGMADSTAIWWWSVSNGRVDLVDYYENHGQPLSHYFKIVKDRGFKYAGHFLPHDARARNFQTGVTTYELVKEALGKSVTSLPILPLQQGIEALRWLFQRDVRIHSVRCAEGLAALRDYSYAFDEDRRTYSTRPSHSWSSHGSDAARYLATAVRPMLRRWKAPDDSKAGGTVKAIQFTLDELYEERARTMAARRRV